MSMLNHVCPSRHQCFAILFFSYPINTSTLIPYLPLSYIPHPIRYHLALLFSPDRYFCCYRWHKIYIHIHTVTCYRRCRFAIVLRFTFSICSLVLFSFLFHFPVPRYLTRIALVCSTRLFLMHMYSLNESHRFESDLFSDSPRCRWYCGRGFFMLERL
ncbi:hypothetical protein BJ165DRAFT_268572 [Panaeolus papilionaceus]|nr:hypothetical protein BJ165DRAFT_268572 [Panaeolus papilionaceus]